MCGIIGYHNSNTTKEDLVVLKKVMVESGIRGRHASGLAWYDGEKIQSYIKPIPIDQLMEEFDLKTTLFDKCKIPLIGHARYSTSNLEYNQPIVTDELAITHNGVVSQRHPKFWETEYGLKCEGKNDSELILRAIENRENPFKKFPGASIAVIWLKANGTIKCSRNAKRPLWQGEIGEGIVVASTSDILRRAGVKNIKKTPCQIGEDDLQRRY